MRILSVAGATSRAGKTALAVTLVRALPRGSAAAVKFTTTEDVFERCPRGTACVVCDIDVPYRLVEDPKVLREAGTDTDRLAAAGASRVVWVIAKASALAPAWRAVQGRLFGVTSVVLEGSTIVPLARPDQLFFVVHPFLASSRWKPTSGPLIARADLVVVNVPAAEKRAPAGEVMAEIARYRPLAEVRVADVARPLAEWAPEVLDERAPLRASASVAMHGRES
jgi:hypothetical protein